MSNDGHETMKQPMTAEWAKQFAQEWTEAWNAHNLDRVMTHYTSEVEFFSPFVSLVLGEPTGRVQGRDTLRAYFAKALIAYPDLRFDLQTVYWGVNSITISYRSVKNLPAAEVMLFDGENRVSIVYAHYAE